MPRYSPTTGALQEYQVGPYSQSHAYIQWGGKLPGDELWSCGLRMVNPTTNVDNNTQMINAGVWQDDIASALESFHTNPLAQISSAAKLSFVKVNAINVDGSYMSQNTNELPLPDVPGAAAGNHPNQVTLAISLTTGYSRGPAHRGRFYMPLPAMDALSDGAISAVAAGNVANAATTLLNDLNAIGNWKVSVFSRKDGAPAARVVTGIEVGRILDTQRRRRNRLPENHVSYP